jgi:Lsr2
MGSTAVDDQRSILAAYAAGDQIAEIVTDLNLPRALVANTVDQLCGYDRARAARVVEDLEAGRPPAPAREPEPAPEPTGEPEPQKPAPPDPGPEPRNFEELLAAATTSGIPAATKLADRIRHDVDELAALLATARAEQAARAKVDRLRAALAKAEAELTSITGTGGARGSALPPGVEGKAVRAWAAEQGLACPAHGRIPKDVIAAYQAAHAERTVA